MALLMCIEIVDGGEVVIIEAPKTNPVIEIRR
jgi:hypothetical protein